MDTAGEIGHQTILPDGPECGCGNRGCLEAVASGPAIAAEGVRLLLNGLAPELHRLTGGDPARVTPKTMVQAVQAGDATVARSIERIGGYLSIAVANLVTSLHPEVIVFGGGVSNMGDTLLQPVREIVRKRVRMFAIDNLRIERSPLGEEAALLGGLALAAQGGLRKG
jgi:glucokinase